MMKPTFSHKLPVKVDNPKYKVGECIGGPWNKQAMLIGVEVRETMTFSVGRWTGRYVQRPGYGHLSELRWEPRYVATLDTRPIHK